MLLGLIWGVIWRVAVGLAGFAEAVNTMFSTVLVLATLVYTVLKIVELVRGLRKNRKEGGNG